MIYLFSSDVPSAPRRSASVDLTQLESKVRDELVTIERRLQKYRERVLLVFIYVNIYCYFVPRLPLQSTTQPSSIDLTQLENKVNRTTSSKVP